MLALKKVLSNNLTVFKREMRLMGNEFEISVVAEDNAWALQRINSAVTEISRVEKLLGAFGDDSEANAINRSAGIKPVKVSGEVFRLVQQALEISALTHGAFDLTYYTADKIFVDHSNSTATVAVPYSITKTNYQGVAIDAKNCTVFLKEKGMRISFAAISKGYAADRAKYILQLEGVSSGVINAGGDLLAWGAQPDNEPWTAFAANNACKPELARLDISNMALATVVNKEQSLKKAEHAKTGFLVSAIEKVSLLSASAAFAGAMAGPVMVMGINAGLYLINQLNQVGCVITDDQNRVYTSKGIRA